jgi:hypothetical protein
MSNLVKLLPLLALALFYTLLMPANACFAEVTVFDTVALVNQDVRLVVQTKARFLSEGGKMVKLSVDGNALKQSLTGGDGYGYFKYHPTSPGLKKVEASSEQDTASGWLLVMEKQQQAIVIEVEGSVRLDFFADQPVGGSLEALKRLSEKYKIIYITRNPFLSFNRKWLDKHTFPQSALLLYNSGAVFDNLEEINIVGLIASMAVLNDAPDSVKHRFSFEEGDDEVHVEGWEEISF